MRVNNTNQTSFGMKEVIVMGNPATKEFAKLVRLVEGVRPRLMEIGDNDTYLLVGRGNGWRELNVCAITGSEKNLALMSATGKSQGRFILNPAKGLYELADSAIFRIKLAFDFYLTKGGYRKTGINLTREQLEELFNEPLDTVNAIAHNIDAAAYRQMLGSHLQQHGSYALGTRR